MAGRGAPRGRRVDELLQRVISEAIGRLSDPRLRLLTITGVSAAKDTAVADVYVQVSGNEKRRDAALAALEACRPVLQGAINREMQLRRTPILRFHYDPSLDEALHISELLRQAEPVLPADGAPAVAGEGTKE